MSGTGSDNGWLEAAIAWEVCASLHRQYCKGKDVLFTTRQSDFVKHAENARKLASRGQAPAQPALALKPLQWSDEREPNEDVRYNHVVAESPLGRITIEWKGWKKYDSRCVYVGGEYIDSGNTLEDAKKIAECHLQNVVEALTTAAPAPVAGDAPLQQGEYPETLYEGGRESVDDALAVVESFGPGVQGLNDTFARQVLLGQEVRRLRAAYEHACQGRSDFRNLYRASRGAAQAAPAPSQYGSPELQALILTKCAEKSAAPQQGEYLPLPEPAIKACHCYSTNQVREAIDADRAARGAAQAAPAEPDHRAVFEAASMYITAYSVMEDSVMAHGHNVHGALSGLIGATDNLREAIGSPMAQSAPVAEDASPHRTDAEIVAQTEELARYLLSWGFNHEHVLGAPATRNSEHPFALRAWDAACHIQDLLTQTDVWNAVAELDDAQAAQPEGGANANR